MTTSLRSRYWCLRYPECGYSGESLAELVEHSKAERLAAWEAFWKPGSETSRQWWARMKEREGTR